ncbi:MAG: sensor histidine kinase [Hamadaea sp.]|uniref:sensor histidine kinase n=1 Tax=Hamadaea sp. TaxID=2024425 RepID=UPI0017A8BABB|nr:sensor domain-containing protein [Hamadaea sp.]NUR71036.1 sensor histidine kinase [Hamadaea sp.]NUT23717.1 sensor histidine kinase [Hamadaea sp.]
MSARLRAFAAGLELYALSLFGLLCLIPVLAMFVPGFLLGLVFLVPGPLLAVRRLTGVVRRRTGELTGIEIREPYVPAPPLPQPQADGWYQRDRQLYKRLWWPRLADRIDWVLGDNATWRDLGWLAVSPLAGLLGVLPLALPVAAAIFAPAPSPLLTFLLVAAGAVVGLAVAPQGLRVTARFHRRLLGGSVLRTDVQDVQADHRVRAWVAKASSPVVRLALLLLTSLVAIPVFAATAIALILGYGVGLVFVVPWAQADLRWLADWRRSLAHWSGVSIPSPYRPLLPLVRRPDGMFRVRKSLYKSERWASWTQRLYWVQSDPATWREFVWRGTDPIIGGLIAGVPVALVVYGIWGLILPRIVHLFVSDSPASFWYGTFFGHPGLAIPGGLILAATGVAIAPAALRLHGRWTRLLLQPAGETVLAQRVEQLTLSRADASDAAARELRRIERDLHDGTQARLVALGLRLGAIEQLIDTDPAAAKDLAGQTREAAALALRELREVVRGIHPPVLAERGLADAVRALALDSPLTVTVDIDLPMRLPEPIEAAAYFSLAEALGNAAKHARARKVAVRLDLILGERTGDPDVLRMCVRDDGQGGADPDRGSGLRGLARRLGIFDGTLSLSSPPGGPTELIMELPCVSSSPRTSTSSGKDWFSF